MGKNQQKGALAFFIYYKGGQSVMLFNYHAHIRQVQTMDMAQTHFTHER